MKEDMNSFIILIGKLAGKKRLGRLRNIWDDSIIMDL